MPGWNENSEWLVDICAERVVPSEHLFQTQDDPQVHMSRADQKNLIDYMAVDNILRRDVMDAKVEKGMFDCLDHFAELIKLKDKDKWIFGRVKKGERRRLRIEWLWEKGIREEYKNELTKVLRVKMGDTVWKKMWGEVYGLIENCMLGVAESGRDKGGKKREEETECVVHRGI